MRQFTAGVNDGGMRLSRFVQKVAPALPAPTMHKAFRNKRVKVNGKRQTAEHRITEGDVIQLYINDEYFPQNSGRAPSFDIKPQSTPTPNFGTEYEDESIAVLYKPAGVLSHKDGAQPALLDAFIHSLIQNGEYDPNKENTFAPALCNRLDRGTEGLVLAAKTAPALRAANEIIRDGFLKKEYLCICAGTPPQGMFNAFLARSRAQHNVTVSQTQTADAKPIATGITVLEEKNGLSLCRIELLTGRTHQIRAHLAFLGAPVLGDAKYGSTAQNRRFGLKEQALCAHTISFAEAMPKDSFLAYLAGKSFSAGNAQILKLWGRL